jgi:pilus assembly protein CpaF
MTLRERLGNEPAGTVLSLRDAAGGVGSKAYQDIKTRFHSEILDRVDLERMGKLDPTRLRAEIASLVEKMLSEQAVALNDSERANLVKEIQNEMLGLGPLEPLLADPTISDILVNTYRSVYVERRGRLERTTVTFADDAHLL